MIETSKDVLYVIISFCILWLTIFISWAIYYLVMILRNTNKMMTSIREKMELVDKILKLIKDKLEKSSSHLAVLADTAIKLTGYFIKQQKKKSKK